PPSLESLPRGRAAVDDDDDRSWLRINRPRLSPASTRRHRARRPFCLAVRQRCAILLRSPEPRHPALPGFDFEAKGTCFDLGRQRLSAYGNDLLPAVFPLPSAFLYCENLLGQPQRTHARDSQEICRVAGGAESKEGLCRARTTASRC